MSKEIYISSTPHETRLAIVEKDELSEIYYERENEYTLAGSIYKGRVTRVLPGMQSSFVDIGLERDAFLYITDFMEEAGDSADFDSGEGRGQRNGGGRDRGDRGGRGRNGERGRHEGARGEQGRSEHGHDEQRSQGAGADDEFDAAPREIEGEDVGEGAPGADGSRRWRGRRGRRRGGRAGAEQGAAAPVEVSPASEDNFGGEREPREERGAREGEGRRERGEGEPREGRRERGGRGREDRGGRDDRQRHDAIRERFAPRGPRHHSGDEGGSADVSASAEPFILPGESLSKYRRGEEPAGESASTRRVAAPAPAAKPSTEMPALVGWDGGATLPGETLSRHRDGGNEAPREAGSHQREGSRDRDRSREESRGGSGRDRRRERDAKRGGDGERSGGRNDNAGRREFTPERELDPAEAVLPAVTSPEETRLPLTDDAPEFETRETEQRLDAEHQLAEEVTYEPETDEATVEAATSAEVLEAVEEAHEVVAELEETVTEYEPGEDASASYRVDPAGPSEFRQGGPAEDDAAPAHEFTTLEPTGDLISEVADADIAPQDKENPASPIEHERAVRSVHSDETQGFAASEEDALTFAPGDGQLEEELLDDDDAEVPHLHASADEEMEEETLEHAADLGSMLREMSIDQITRPEEPSEDDEDDFDIDEEEIEEDEFETSEEISGSEVSEAEEEEDAEAASFDEEDEAGAEATTEEGAELKSEGQRRGRRDGRRSGGGRERGGRERRGPGGSRGGRAGRHSVQATDLPAISDLLKPGQEVLVQIAKEPIAKKGARITSHIALPGRFLVFMPTVNHIGVSRKIESDSERRRLKEVLLNEKGEASGGFIVRTAASGASEDELRSDLRFLLNLWADIKQRSESSKPPSLIYHDLNLVERILRDQVTDNFSAIWVDTEAEYERVLRFLQRFQPALIRRVKLYSKETPLFEQFGIAEEINKALRSKVWLKSGGSIVINQTEALVAIDINTGKYVGKTARLEDTIVKTNLDAIPEIVRQIRLRDLGGIIIIDFIDMDERKNRHKVMAALEEELKKDRAPSKVLQFNDFGLVAITRKRVKQSLERTLSTTCGVCTGTGMVKSPVTVCNEIYIELRKMHRHLDKGDIMLRVNPEVVKQLKSNGGKWLQDMEELSNKTILVKSDPSLHPEQFDIH